MELNTSQSCKEDFNAKYAYVLDQNDSTIHENSKKIYIEEYLNNTLLKLEVKSKQKCLVCKRGHLLKQYDSTERSRHFQHINAHDINMSEWHSEWQTNFPLHTREQELKKKNNLQIRDRRADVLLDNKVIEFQHSNITSKEVQERQKDYTLHNKEIIWVIDGNDTIVETFLLHSKRTYLEFKGAYWKYDRFISYKYIYINIKNKIYRIEPNRVKSHMIDVHEYKLKNDFIISLKNNTTIFSDDNPIQTTLYVKQEGAGNGKTYGSIQLLQDEQFEDKECFIMITKQHSAKEVIKKEWDDQIKRNALTHLELIHIEPKSKKYIITYRNLNINKPRTLIIATVDSLMYKLGNKKHKEQERFVGIVNSIIDGHIEADRRGITNYANNPSRLCKKMLIIIDETQDLEPNYINAIERVQRDRYVDAYVVGDKLQSISKENNSFTILDNNIFPNTYIKRYENKNICRRFGDNVILSHFVNAIVPFKKYNLPEIDIPVAYKNSHNSLYKHCYSNVYDNIGMETLIERPYVVYQSIETHRASEKKINRELQKVVNYMEEEIQEHGYVPEDFLFVTPFVSISPFGDALEQAIQQFWIDKFTDKQYQQKVLQKHTYWKNKQYIDTYTTYAKFHKSEEGTSIDVKISEHATRMVSIHSSKGDGRPVVFVFGLTEAGLKNYFCNGEKNLQYESLIHVALTRMKKKLYISYINNGDDFCNRLHTYLGNAIVKDTSIKPDLKKINKNIDYSKLLKLVNKNDFSNINEDIIHLSKYTECPKQNKTNSEIIDIEHHYIRYSILSIYLQIFIVSKNIHDSSSQIFTILKKVSKAIIIHVDLYKEYNKYIRNKDFKQCIPIQKFSNKGKDYKTYFTIIEETCNTIKKKLKEFIHKCQQNIYYQTKECFILCPYECIILYYMIEVYNNRQYSQITMMNVYELTEQFYTTKLYKHKHQNCRCSEYFTKWTSVETTLANHYNDITKIENIYKNISLKYPNCKWLVNHPITFGGSHTDFKIRKRFSFIAYNENVVISCDIKPQLNELNYNDILIDSIFNNYLISTSEYINKSKQITTENKQLLTCIFTLDFNEPVFINWTNNQHNLIDNNSQLLVDILKQNIKKYFEKYHDIFYNFVVWCSVNSPNQTSMGIIDYVNEQYNQYEKIPEYMYKIITLMEDKIEEEDDEEEHKNILNKYLNRNVVIKKLNQKLEKSIKLYMT